MRFLALTLIATLAVPAVAADEKQTASGGVGGTKEKLICKREVPIGSLIATRKTCMTKAQWEAQGRDGNDEARRMIEMNQGRPTGN